MRPWKSETDLTPESMTATPMPLPVYWEDDSPRVSRTADTSAAVVAPPASGFALAWTRGQDHALAAIRIRSQSIADGLVDLVAVALGKGWRCARTNGDREDDEGTEEPGHVSPSVRKNPAR